MGSRMGDGDSSLRGVGPYSGLPFRMELPCRSSSPGADTVEPMISCDEVVMSTEHNPRSRRHLIVSLVMAAGSCEAMHVDIYVRQSITVCDSVGNVIQNFNILVGVGCESVVRIPAG